MSLVAGRPMGMGGWTAALDAPAGASESEQFTSEANILGRMARGGESPVAGRWWTFWVRIVSTAGHEKPRGKLGRPRSKAKYHTRPIVEEYREGKVKSSPARGVKKT